MRLATGLEIDDPWELLREMRERYYEAYDGIPVEQDNRLRVLEIALSIMLNSRISGNTAWAIYEGRAPIEAALQGIPADVDLLDVDVGCEIPGMESIKAAVGAICKIKRAKISGATKVLSKKRPAIIPIFDDKRVYHYYRQFLPKSRPSRTWGQETEALILLFHQDMHSVGDELRDLAARLREISMPITHCRILDHLIWKAREGDGS